MYSINKLSQLRDMKTCGKYIRHWLGYCYYRSVNLYSSFYEEPAYYYGSIPLWLIAFFLLLICSDHGSGICLNRQNLTIVFLAMAILTPLYFNSKKYMQIEAIFRNEDKRTEHFLGYLVIATFAIPAIASLIYMVC